MLEDIELITLSYLLIVEDHTCGFIRIKLIYYSHKRYGKAYYYDKDGVLVGRWVHNVKKAGHDSEPVIELDVNGNITRMTGPDSNGHLIDIEIGSKEYIYHKNRILGSEI